MKQDVILKLAAGAKLLLKPERARAYGLGCRRVELIEVQRRFDYKVGFVLGKDWNGEVGHYRPQDFAGVEMERKQVGNEMEMKWNETMNTSAYIDKRLRQLREHACCKIPLNKVPVGKLILEDESIL